MSYDRLAPTISSKAKKLFGSGNMGRNNWGGAVPLSDGLDTRSCKILDPRLKEPALCQLYRRTFVAYDVTRHASNGPLCRVHIRRTSLTSIEPEV